MRKNYNYNAAVPATRNDFIECLRNKTEAIVINHVLLEKMDKDLKGCRSNGRASKFFKGTGIGILSTMSLASNPVTSFAIGTLVFVIGKVCESELKEYKIYAGYDVNNYDILVLVHKEKVDEKYDSI